MKKILILALGVLWPAESLATSEVVRSFFLADRHFHAGRLAISAYPKWETAVVGPIPFILGAVKHGSRVGAHFQPAMKVIAIVSQDRSAHALMVAKEQYAAIAANPSVGLVGKKMLLTQQSTAQMFVEKCLAGWNLKLDQLTVINGEQAQLRRSLAEKTAPIAVFWIPFTYLGAAGPAEAKVLPCAGAGNFDLPSVIVARSDLLNDPDPTQLAANRKRIAQVVARYLGAWALAKKKPVDAAKRLVKVYQDEDVKVTEAQARSELTARQPPDLDGQRAAFNRSPAALRRLPTP